MLGLLVLMLTTQQTPSAPPRTLEFTGFVLVNGFYNSARVNNSDVPQFAENDPIERTQIKQEPWLERCLHAAGH